MRSISSALLVLLAVIPFDVSATERAQVDEGLDAVWIWVQDERGEPLPGAEIIIITEAGDLEIGQTNAAGGFELLRLDISDPDAVSLAICHENYYCGVVVRIERDFELAHKAGRGIRHALAPIVLY